ncbi:MAG: polyribonucleotide nucleotidyltransferase, partial [Spirochaetaceae bacterium]|nr:polyribonucleotide nucleotidyltransferase [Spirochaetaceae bacterium]
MTHTVKYKIGNADLVLETGRLAKQANGAVFATYGGSAVLATVCSEDSESAELDYVPLSVEYNEKFYAAGKIPGGFLKREARPRDKEILVSRLIDRPMRPLFNKKFKREIQIVPTTVSTDKMNPPDMIAMVASSAAVVISDIPFGGPVAAVRVCSVNGELIINPTFPQIEESEMDIVVAGTTDGITMVEGGASEVPEETLLAALEKAHLSIKELCKIQMELRELAGKEKLPLSASAELVLENRDEIWAYAYPKMETACFVKGKHLRVKAIKALIAEAFERYTASIPETHVKVFYALMEEMETAVMRTSIASRGIRTDGRGPEDIRPITCEVGVLPR